MLAIIAAIFFAIAWIINATDNVISPRPAMGTSEFSQRLSSGSTPMRDRRRGDRHLRNGQPRDSRRRRDAIGLSAINRVC